ncbi:MAG: hypothetical protein PHI53_00855 [Candidatus Pacebacteria bacterium]|nr:hypothetical protein [Candidatus Paceibacterota bacterium]
MEVFDWYTTTVNSLMDLWGGFIEFVPRLIGALVIFIIGWFISVIIGKIVAEVLKRIKFNKIFEKGDIKGALDRAELKVDASSFVGAIIKWILVIVFLSATVEVLGLVQFASFLNDVLSYLPNVVVAVLIFVVTVIITDITEKLVRAALESTKIGHASWGGAIAKWSIWVFAIFAILYQLQIAPGLIQTLLQGIVGLLVVSFGLAFGLGGKDVAAEILGNLKKKLQR